MIRLLKKRGMRSLFVVGGGLIVFVRWVISSPVGLLFTSLIFYFLTPVIFGYKPYSFYSLADWIISQNENVKIAIAGSLLTTIGFVTAFSISNSAWRLQRRVEVRLEVGKELHSFFREAWDSSLLLQLYAEEIIDARKALQDFSALPELERENFDWSVLESQIIFLKQRTARVIEERNRLSELAQKVHSIRSRYELVLSQSIILMKGFDSAQKSLVMISERMWFLVLDVNADIAHTFAFIHQGDSKSWEDFLAIAGDCRINGEVALGQINGKILGDLFTPNIWTIFSFNKIMRQIAKENF